MKCPEHIKISKKRKFKVFADRYANTYKTSDKLKERKSSGNLQD